MAADELIDFDIIENSKENIQPLKEGRSAKALASVLSPIPSGRSGKSPTLDETKTLNDAIRAEYEIELQSIADSDDPLDIYDRYVKWTLNAYPSAQSTPQSQLLPLLERATKAFLASSHYKNDPRYLKLWLHYIRLFSDTPRETFAFLARHNIGENLGLFYEEFAAWLETAGRWNQAEEVYKMGVEKDARPAERLVRKYGQFQQRFEARPVNADEPCSPALPTVRPALAAKIDPFAPASTDSPQTAQAQAAGRNTTSRSGKPKMAIFSDAGEDALPSQAASKGWDSIGTIKDRKKENTIEARPWAGETLKAGGRVGTVSKMEVFKDPSRMNESHKPRPSKSSSNAANPRTGRAERAFVNMQAVYPSEHEEYSFEELRATSRGWSQRDWRPKPPSPVRPVSGNAQDSPAQTRSPELVNIENLNESFQQNLSIIDNSTQSMVGMPPPKQKPRRLKVREVKQDVQTVKTRLESPTGPKIRRKNSAEATMTFHSKAATNEIYDMFNQPLQKPPREDTQSGDETDYGDETSSTAGESTGTGRISAATSDFGDDTLASIASGCEDNTSSQPESLSPWSDFTASKHVPKLDTKRKHKHASGDDMTENMSSSQNQTQTTGLDVVFDTQAIEAIANQNFDDMDTKAIALIAGAGAEEEDDIEQVEEEGQSEEVKTAVEPEYPAQMEIQNEPRYVPLPPEDYEPTPLRSFRDPMAVAQNKLPFMTPIAEQTESSVAPSTLWKDADYFSSKTPSRPGHKLDSPSKLRLDELLMSSPQKEPSPQCAAKRRLEHTGASEEELLTSSPRKKPAHSSPVRNDEKPPVCDVHQLQTTVEPTVEPTEEKKVFKIPLPPARTQSKSLAQPCTTGPIINDLQCNPCDPSVRQQILNAINPPLHSYDGFTDISAETFNHTSILKNFTDKLAKQKPAKFSPRKSQADKNLTKAVPPILNFTGSSRIYAVKRELGKGAFAPVHLVDSCDRSEDGLSPSTTPAGSPSKSSSSLTSTSASVARQPLEALKSESPPHTLVWEFYILCLIRTRIPPSSRSLHSIITAHECHLYRDECYLVLAYSPQGTLLDLVNHFRSENTRAGKPTDGVGIDEPLVMFFAVELLRTMQSLHSIGILHGDLKVDNCLVRLDTTTDLTGPYSVTGKEAWSSKGLILIDFGRGIDTHTFKKEAKFVADWDAHAEDCPEIHAARPWKHQIDFYGAAGVIHSMLFGRYLESVPVNGSTVGAGGGEDQTIRIGAANKKQYKVKEAFKRYWDKEIWSDVFGVLLNKGGEEDEKVREAEVGRVRRAMEEYLEREGERRDLRGLIRRAERLVGSKK